jgi:hypothetical protein
MHRIGYTKVWLMGGAFDYGKYQKATGAHGWSRWPVRIVFVCTILAISSLWLGLAERYGLNAKRRPPNAAIQKAN